MHHRPRVPAMSLARLVLTSGRAVHLAELHMSSTYGGPLAIYPCRPVDDDRIRQLLRTAEQVYPGAPVHLIPPREYPDQYPGSSGPVEVLPGVACLGSFRSEPLDPAHHHALHRSCLTVVWFQPTARAPSGCDAEPALRELPWERLAVDEEIPLACRTVEEIL
ncbi:hypothetical protein GCM10009535_42970 [Streptomyces thermocarboxydovorans]|uniref:Uncharacterized protein n=2 Tax=Streptomyces thermocarboxydovorans TaxID=59298 RepID=A0ABP3ST18_9ACTN